MHPIVPWVAAGGLLVGGGLAVPEKTDAVLTALHLLAPRSTTAGQLPRGVKTTLTREIDRRTTDPHVRTAMRVGAVLEAGGLTGPWPCGDSGWACGPFQVNRLANPSVRRADSLDTAWSVRFMLPRYRQACASVPAGRWRTDPRGAAATCVFRAERPRHMYTAGRVRAAWHTIGGK